MVLKESGVPVPIPSDLVMITAGIQASLGTYSVAELLVAVAVAICVGNSLQFLAIRGAGRRLVERFGGLVGLSTERIDRTVARLRERGALAVFLGLNVPGARAGVIPAAGLAGLPYPTFILAALAGSALFYSWHVALGFVVGPAATAAVESLNVQLLALVAVLALVGLFAWLLVRRHRADVPERSATLERLRLWTEASCPACLAAVALAGRLPRGG